MPHREFNKPQPGLLIRVKAKRIDNIFLNHVTSCYSSKNWFGSFLLLFSSQAISPTEWKKDKPTVWRWDCLLANFFFFFFAATAEVEHLMLGFCGTALLVELDWGVREMSAAGHQVECAAAAAHTAPRMPLGTRDDLEE